MLTPFSICVKTRYHPHQIIYTAVLKLYEELIDLKQSQTNDPSLSAKSATLERGFKLLDEVIDYSHCTQDESLPVIELTLSPPPCSFCGGEIFRTVFCCAGSCIRDGATDGSAECKILICSHCFIDGRACHCGSMDPYRLQPLDKLIELRKNIANLLDLSDGNSLEPPWVPS